MGTEIDGPTLGDIILGRLDELGQDLKDLREGFVSEKAWEVWRRENYAPRIQRVEDDVRKIQEGIAGRFRSNTMNAVTHVGYPLVVAVLLYVATRGGH